MLFEATMLVAMSVGLAMSVGACPMSLKELPRLTWLLTDADQVPGEGARPGNGKAAVLAAAVGPVGSQL